MVPGIFADPRLRSPSADGRLIGRQVNQNDHHKRLSSRESAVRILDKTNRTTLAAWTLGICHHGDIGLRISLLRSENEHGASLGIWPHENANFSDGRRRLHPGERSANRWLGFECGTGELRFIRWFQSPGTNDRFIQYCGAGRVVSRRFLSRPGGNQFSV